MYKTNWPVLLLGLTAGCAFNSSSTNSKPINLSGKFQVRLNHSAQYFKDDKQYPIAGTLINDVPYANQFLPANSGIIGMYKNGGFKCSIVWTAIILADGTSLSNSKGIALSRCGARSELTESEPITAKWN